MNYFLTKEAVIKWLEKPSVYHMKTDELYELDDDSFAFLKKSASEGGAHSGDKAFIDYCLQEKLLTTQKISIRRPPLIKSPVPSLRYLELQITDRCNLRCRHCYIDPPSPPFSKGIGGFELSLNQTRKILKEFEEMQGLRVLITGGEPFMQTGFAAINSMLGDFSIRKVLFSNGSLITPQVLGDLNVDEIQISIDGLEIAHDALRGPGTFRKAMEAVRLCLDAGFDVSISTMVHSKNLNDFDEMDRLFREMGIRDWTVDVPCVSGRFRNNTDFQIMPEQGGKYLRYGFGEGLHGGGEGFGCGLHLMSVMADGKMTKCTFYADRSVGTVHDRLRECWQKIKPVALKDLSCDCEYLEACRGGCRYRAEILGDACGKDLYRCALYDIINIEK